MEHRRQSLGIDSVRTPRGEIRIIVDRCRGCGSCVEHCPNHVLAISSKVNKNGVHPPQVVRGDDCAGCNLCELICPDFAIQRIPAGAAGQ